MLARSAALRAGLIVGLMIEGSAAVLVPSRSPASAAPVVNEIVARPRGGEGEWIEIHNAGDASVDLQGFSISDGPNVKDVIASSVVVPARGFVVLAYSDDGNLGFTPDVVFGASAASRHVMLRNTGDQISLSAPDGTLVDWVDYTPAEFPRVMSGRSLELKVLDPSQNDLGGSWCRTIAAAFNAAGERGTPGTVNACP